MKAHTHNFARPSGGRFGFTLTELIIGLLLLAIVGGAVAAVASSVTRGWQLGEAKGASTLTINRTMLRIQDKIQRCRSLGLCYAGSVTAPNSAPGAAILFWREDVNADGLMQLEETQLLEYDPAAKALFVTEVQFPTAAARANYNGPFATSKIATADAIEEYKLMQYKVRYAITKNVAGAAFNVIAPTTPSQRATFEFRIKFDGTNGETIEYGTATPRMPLS